MKKSIVITLVVLALLVSSFAAAFAAKGTQYVNVTVINRTHGSVDLKLQENGELPLYYTFADAGTNKYAISVPEGSYYNYTISTKCQYETGTWNLSRNRILTVYCEDSGSINPELRTPGLTPQ